jgi:hypothetical protein
VQYYKGNAVPNCLKELLSLQGQKDAKHFAYRSNISWCDNHDNYGLKLAHMELKQTHEKRKDIDHLDN